MAKKMVIVLILVALVTGGVFAQDDGDGGGGGGGGMFTSFAPGLENTKVFINAGVGIGLFPVWTEKLVVPPIEANVMIVLPIGLPLSVGGAFSFTSGKDDDNLYYRNVREVAMMFGAKAAWHVNFGIQRFDAYVGVFLGWIVWNLHREYGSWWTLYHGDASVNYSQFGYAFNVGIRYFFTNNIGVYLEVGYSPLTLVAGGLTLRF